MNPTRRLHELGQSLWLDNITRGLLTSGTLARYVSDYSVTGLTSNPTIFEQAIGHSDAYDEAIRRRAGAGESGEALFFALALEDLRRAADLFRPAFDASRGVDGWASLEVSPLLADDSAGSIAAAARLHALSERPNLFIKIPGTPEGVVAIEESIFAGVPINVTLLFSAAHYAAAADAYMKGMERRVAAGLSPDIRSVASVFISRWDRGVAGKVPAALQNKLGVAVGQQAYKAYRDVLDSDRWQRLENFGARPQRLLFASTSMKDPGAPDTLYVSKLAAPNTVNTMPAGTLRAFGEHGEVGGVLPRDGGDSAQVLAEFAKAGIDTAALAAQLQSEGAKSFVGSWQELLGSIETKSKALA
jgi:transaldolase